MEVALRTNVFKTCCGLLPCAFKLSVNHATLFFGLNFVSFQSSEVESRTQGSRPRPRTQKNPRPRPRTAFPRTDTFEAKDRNARGQGQPFRGQTLSRPRTGMLEAKDQGHKRKCSPKKKGLRKNFSGDLQKQKKRSSQTFFKRSPQKNVFQKIFQALRRILTIQKIVLSSSRGQANFRGLEASRPRPRTSKSVLEDSTSVNHIVKCPGAYLGGGHCAMAPL